MGVDPVDRVFFAVGQHTLGQLGSSFCPVDNRDRSD